MRNLPHNFIVNGLEDLRRSVKSSIREDIKDGICPKIMVLQSANIPARLGIAYGVLQDDGG